LSLINGDMIEEWGVIRCAHSVQMRGIFMITKYDPSRKKGLNRGKSKKTGGDSDKPLRDLEIKRIGGSFKGCHITKKPTTQQGVKERKDGRKPRGKEPT